MVGTSVLAGEAFGQRMSSAKYKDNKQGIM